MSYIRCTSNPESLYVFGSVGDHHDFSWTDHNDDMQMMSMPSEDFDEFFKQLKTWEDEHDLWDEIFECRGIRLRTVTFHEGLKRTLTDEEIEEREKIHMFDRDGRTNRLICMTYKDNPPLLMWKTTWWYLKDSAYEDAKAPPWLKWKRMELKWWFEDLVDKEWIQRLWRTAQPAWKILRNKD